MIKKIKNKAIELLPLPWIYIYDLVTARIFRGFKYNKSLVKSFCDTKFDGYHFGRWALTKASLIYFCANLFNDQHSKSIVELGGGSSTIFFSHFIKNSGLPLNVYTLEHDKEWINKLRKTIGVIQALQINFSPLKKYTDKEIEVLFSDPENADFLNMQSGIASSNIDVKDTRARNLFYQLDAQTVLPESIDGLIVDGPHGNGRSLVFPLLFRRIHKGTIVLIDDFNHYHFLDDLSKVFSYEIIRRFESPLNGKAWVLVKII